MNNLSFPGKVRIWPYLEEQMKKKIKAFQDSPEQLIPDGLLLRKFESIKGFHQLLDEKFELDLAFPYLTIGEFAGVQFESSNSLDLVTPVSYVPYDGDGRYLSMCAIVHPEHFFFNIRLDTAKRRIGIVLEKHSLEQAEHFKNEIVMHCQFYHRHILKEVEGMRYRIHKANDMLRKEFNAFFAERVEKLNRILALNR